MEHSSVSKLLTETDFIDILFHTCDVWKTGRVPVSSIISYLEKMTDTKKQHRKAVKQLSAYLDPMRENCEVDLETYRHGMCTWIKQLGTRQSDDSSSDDEDCTHKQRLKSVNRKPSEYLQSGKGFSDIQIKKFKAEEDTCQSERENNTWNQLENLQQANRRLSQKNNKLQSQVDLQEDSLAAITEENTKLMDKIHRLQEVADLQSEIVSENEELKAMASQCQEQKNEQEKRILQLERENASVVTQLTEYEVKLNEFLSEREMINNLIKDLQKKINNQKFALQEAEDVNRSQKMELVEKEQALKEVRTNLKELSKITDELKGSNKELQIHLLQTQHELARNSLQNQPVSNQTGLPLQDVYESDDENGVQASIRILPYPLPEFSVTTESSCIQTEIRARIKDDEFTPCPLSSKEHCEMLTSPDEIWVIVDDMDFDTLLQQLTDKTMDSFLAAFTKEKPFDRSKDRQSSVISATEWTQGCPSEQEYRHNKSENLCENLGCAANISQRCQDIIRETFKQFLLKVTELKEDNKQLRELHDMAVDTILNMEDEFYTRVTSSDTRIMVLWDILQEEHAQRIKLQEQVVLLKKILGIVDRKQSLNLDTVQDILCRQQDKIDCLKKSNLELAEKFHKAELKITDLQEEAVHIAQSLDKEKHRCHKLEDESCGSAPWEDIKEKIIQEIVNLQNRLQSSEFEKESLNGRTSMALPLFRRIGHGKANGHCCGYRCISPSSPLVDALTIDFFNGNYYPLLQKSRTTTAGNNPYLTYLHMSCEDVDCVECRAYRLGLDFQGIASCPSLQRRLGHDIHQSLSHPTDCQNVATARDFNFNSQASYKNQHGDRGGDLHLSPSKTAAKALSTSFDCYSAGNIVPCNSHNNTGPDVNIRNHSTSAKHRRLDFQKGSSRYTSGTTDSCTSTSVDSSHSNLDCPSYRAFPDMAVRNKDGPEQIEPGFSTGSSTLEYSPAKCRRMSFLAAVEKSKEKDTDWNRRPSYRAAIDPRYLAGDDDILAGESTQKDGLCGGVASSHADGKADNKTVTFQLNEGSHASLDSRNIGGPSLLTSGMSSPSESENVLWSSTVALPTRGIASGQPRKLSVLLEEEDAEDIQKTPEKYNPAHYQQCDFSSAKKEIGSFPLSSHLECLHPESGKNRYRDPLVYGSPRILSSDMKGSHHPVARGEEDKAISQQAACNAENVPAYFKRLSEQVTTAALAPVSVGSTSTVTSTCFLPGVISSSSVVLVPGSPPQTPRSTHDNHLPETIPSRLAKLRENNLARKREQMKTMKMPELSERRELDSELSTSNGVLSSTFRKCASATSSQNHSASHISMASATSSQNHSASHISMASGDNDDASRKDYNSEEVIGPPSPSNDPVTPSIPDSFLIQLGLFPGYQESANGEGSGIDQLPDKELERRFNSLSLAFRTDRLTLDKRLGIQERSRDIAEQNIDKELQGLRDALELLNSLCVDERVQEVIYKIHHHLDILEQSLARVSCRAEVFGAVQQEKRISLAMDVMITHTENVKRLREKEQTDVEEARKVLNERKISAGPSLDTLNIGDRRSSSIGVGLPRTTRRRSEAALPRFIGCAGIQSLQVSSSMESGFQSDIISQSSPGSSTRPFVTDTAEEPRQKFQTATANMVVRNVVSNTLRRASLGKQKNVSFQSSSSSSGHSSSRSNSVEKSHDDEQQLTKQNSQEEEAYRYGYEEGLKISLSRELTDLRDKHNNISSSLEQVMERVKNKNTELEDTVSKLKGLVLQLRQWMSNPNWQSTSITLRKIATGTLVLIAVLVAIVTFSQSSEDGLELRNHGKPPQ